MSTDQAQAAEQPPSLEDLLLALTPTQRNYLEALPEHNWRPWKTGNALGLGEGTVCRWMEEPRFLAARAALITRRLEAMGATYERVLMEVVRVATADIRDVVGDDGEPLPPSEWEDDAAAALQALDIETRSEGRGEDRVEYTVTKFKLHPKMEALKLLATLHGKLVERHEHTHAVTSIEQLEAARARAVERSRADATGP